MIRATLFDRGQVADLLIAYAHASTYCSEDRNTAFAALIVDVFEAKTREDKKKRKREFSLSSLWTILGAFLGIILERFFFHERADARVRVVSRWYISRVSKSE